jgi:hypothetical protein
MLFGLSNTAQTFQRMMDRTTDGLLGVFAYMDDSRVGSPDMFAYMDDSRVGSPNMFAYMDDSRVGSPDRHLEAFSNVLATNGLNINLEKCVFTMPSLEILGHTISVTGLAPTAGHAAEIKSCPPPQTSSNCNVFSAW